MEKKDEPLIYLIDSLKDYLNYKQARQKREKEIKRIKRTNKSKNEKVLFPMFAGEEIENIYSVRNNILIDSILSYIEDMNGNEIDDAKTIQLMLLKLAHGRCDEETYKRIMNVDRVVASKASNNFRFEAGSNNSIYTGRTK